MPLPTETGNKKHIIAERFFETGVSENLSKLFICDFPDFQVLSVYSDLDKRFIAYKVIQQSMNIQDPWHDAAYLKKRSIDFNPSFNLVPLKFAESSESAASYEHIAVQPPSPEGKIHFSRGLIQYNAISPSGCNLYLFKNEDNLSILIFNGKDCKLANSFQCKNETEMLYFILNALKVTGLTQEQTHVYLDYNLAVVPSVSLFFKPYFKSVENMKLNPEDLDKQIPFLAELLFPNFLMSLCE